MNKFDAYSLLPIRDKYEIFPINELHTIVYVRDQLLYMYVSGQGALMEVPDPFTREMQEWIENRRRNVREI